MRDFLMCSALFAIALTAAPTWAADVERPDRALCPVCAVSGEAEFEKVRAETLYEGKHYYFCNDGCRKEFEAEPLFYVPQPIPRPAPAFTVTGLGGETATQATFENEVVLLDFWATWCKPCVKSMPELQRLHDTYADHGLRVVGVSIDATDDRIKKVTKFIDKYDITYPIMMDAAEIPAWYEYRVKAVPAMFLIDRDGAIVAEWKGKVDLAGVEKAVQLALGATIGDDS